jgi:hypothetical protein
MKLPGNRIAIGGVVFAILVVAFFWGGTVIGKVTGNWQNSISPAEYSALLHRK